MKLAPSIAQFLQALGIASLEAALLTCIVLTIQMVCGRKLSARWRYALWLPVALRLVLPVAIPSSFSLFNVLHWNPGSTATHRQLTVRTDLSPNGSVRAMRGSQAFPPPRPAPAPLPLARTPGDIIVLFLFSAWAVVTAFLLARLALGELLFNRRLKRGSSTVNPEVADVLRECQQQMSIAKKVRLHETGEVEYPALFGWRQPRLLLPRNLTTKLTLPELRHIFYHELAHLKRSDVWWNYLLTGLFTIHWFNPILWFAFARLKSDRELACDELALFHTSPPQLQSYGATIIKLIESLQTAMPHPGLIGISSERHQMRRRISLVANHGKPKWPSGIPVLILALLSITGLTDAQTTSGQNPAIPPASTEKRLATAFTTGEALLDQTKNSGSEDRKPLAGESATPAQASQNNPPAASPAIALTESTKLQTRLFRVDSRTFLESLESIGARDPKSNLQADLQRSVQLFFEHIGIKVRAPGAGAFEREAPSEKSVFYNHGAGLLFVRATREDLDVVETAVMALNTTPPQVTIDARIVEIDAAQSGKLGLDWFLGNPSANANRSDNKTRPKQNPTPSEKSSNSSTGILTASQLNPLLRALETTRDADLLATPRVTTLSGRQASISVLNDPTPEEKQQGIPSTGPTLGILPTVGADGFSIHLKIDFSLVTREAKTAVIHTRELSTAATLQDGQTMVLGGLSSSDDGKKMLLILITPTLIDPAGNRIHQPGDIPGNLPNKRKLNPRN